MKNLLAALALLVGSATFATAQTFTLEESNVVDYGTIVKGANGVRDVKFTNTGKSPLIIESAQGSCGCTVPSYPKEPIMPGQSQVISIKYDTQRVGMFEKKVTLKTNSVDANGAKHPDFVLTIKGDVKAEEAATPEKAKTFMN